MNNLRLVRYPAGWCLLPTMVVCSPLLVNSDPVWHDCLLHVPLMSRGHWSWEILSTFSQAGQLQSGHEFLCYFFDKLDSACDWVIYQWIQTVLIVDDQASCVSTARLDGSQRLACDYSVYVLSLVLILVGSFVLWLYYWAAWPSVQKYILTAKWFYLYN